MTPQILAKTLQLGDRVVVQDLYMNEVDVEPKEGIVVCLWGSDFGVYFENWEDEDFTHDLSFKSSNVSIKYLEEFYTSFQSLKILRDLGRGRWFTDGSDLEYLEIIPRFIPYDPNQQKDLESDL